MDFSELYHIAKNSLEELSHLDEADFRLEQAVYNEAEEAWEIVVSYLVENTNQSESPLSPLAPFLKYDRVYKK